MEAEGDIGKASLISDHPFVAPDGEPWGLCVTCRLSEAAHAESMTPYREVIESQPPSSEKIE